MIFGGKNGIYNKYYTTKPTKDWKEQRPGNVIGWYQTATNGTDKKSEKHAYNLAQIFS